VEKNNNPPARSLEEAGPVGGVVGVAETAGAAAASEGNTHG